MFLKFLSKSTKEKSNEDPLVENNTLDKIVMGLIIGGAIGSALGLGLAPEEGSKTRKKVKETGKLTWKLTKAIYEIAKKRSKNLIEKKLKKK